MANTDFSLPEGTHTVVLGMGDLNGIMRGKRIPASNWANICDRGNALSVALFAIDMTCDVWDTPYVSFDNGFPDMHMFPMSKPVPIPWEPGVAMCMGRAEGMDHQTVPLDPRQVLVHQVERAGAMGLEVSVGCEVEFYLLDPETRRPRDQGIQVYGLERAAELEHVLGPIRQQIDEMGLQIEQSNPEYAAGQVEVNLRYGPAMESADRLVMFRSLVKQLAAEHGYMASFMAKPFFEESGNGFHAHYSIWQDGQNIFADAGRLSAAGRSFLAGIQARMAEAAICGTTTPNAFRRRQPFSFCPTNTTWGVDNRTVALRVILGSDSAIRVEQRDGSADCNPYLKIAADIAAGLDGIEAGMEPGPETTGNGYEDEDAAPLPADIGAAIRLAEGSDWLKGVLGDMMHTILLQQANREAEFVGAQVTPVELDRYLANF